MACKKLKKVKRHLRGDRKTWQKIEKIAHDEAASDKHLLKKLGKNVI